MNFYIILLICVFGRCHATSNMVIFWGTPSNILESNKISVDSWNSCVSKCYNDSQCLIALSKSKIPTSECYLYSFRNLPSIQIHENEIENGGIVALKKYDFDQCPASQSDVFPIKVIFPGGLCGGLLTIDGDKTLLNYSCALDTCDGGWTLFQRIQKTVCLRVFNESILNQDEAESLCNKLDSTLAGLENRNETEWIHAQALLSLPSDYEDSYIFLGGRKKKECVEDSSLSSCNPNKTEAFEWTDTSVTGKEGWEFWYPKAPNNYNGDQFCIELTIARTANLSPATVDDIRFVEEDYSAFHKCFFQM